MRVLALSGLDREATVEVWQQLTMQQAVGLLSARHLVQTHLLDPTILRGAEQTLDSTFRLRTVGQDQVDVEFLQGATNSVKPSAARPLLCH